MEGIGAEEDIIEEGNGAEVASTVEEAALLPGATMVEVGTLAVVRETETLVHGYWVQTISVVRSTR